MSNTPMEPQESSNVSYQQPLQNPQVQPYQYQPNQPTQQNPQNAAGYPYQQSSGYPPVQPQFQPQFQSQFQPPYQKEKKRGSFWGGFAVAAIVCICALFLGILVSSGFKKSDSNAAAAVSSKALQTEVLTQEQAQQLVDKVEKLIYYIQMFFVEEVEVEDLLDGAYHGIVDALGDKYAEYFNEEELMDFSSSSSGEYVGIGVTVMVSETGMGAEVISVNQNGGAYEVGIEPGDILVAADGTDLSDMDLNEMVSYIRGEEGSYVNITFNREGKEETVSIERRALTETAVYYTMLEDGVAYLSLTEFTSVAVEQFETALSDLESQGMKSLILDLRDNGGGLVDVCVDIADTMIDTGLVTYMEDKYGFREEYKATRKGCIDVPIVILINENTASASELLTTCLQDYGKVKVVGSLSYGKGIVQTTYNLMDGTAIKMTTAKYYSPNGTNVQDIGITPDYEVEFPEDISLAKIKKQGIPDADQDPQLQKALEVIRSEMKGTN